jgi:rhodanese-related sulfurtransferase
MKKVILLLSISIMISISMSAQNTSSVKNLNPQDFKKEIEGGKYLIIDVRTPAEFSQGHIKHALNIDMNDQDFVKKVAEITKKNKHVALYCRSGRRSKVAASALEPLKLRIIELNQGIISWVEAGY